MLAEISPVAMMAGVGLGATIKQRREALDMQQGELAEIVGVEQSSASAWESEKTLPRADKLPRIAIALRCSVGELVRGIDTRYDEARKKDEVVTYSDSGPVSQSGPSKTQSKVAGGSIHARARLSSHDATVGDLERHVRHNERTVAAIIKHAKDIARLSDALDGILGRPPGARGDAPGGAQSGHDVRQAGSGKKGVRR